MSNNDALREAIQVAAQYTTAMSSEDAMIVETANREALAASKLDSLRDVLKPVKDAAMQAVRYNQRHYREVMASSKPEPQAQAGEPELHCASDWGGRETGPWLITLDDYRQAVAPLQQAARDLARIKAAIKIKGGDEHYPTEWAYLQACKLIDAQKDTIAKKDAALKACVDVATGVEERRKARVFYMPEDISDLIAVIQQAEEALSLPPRRIT